MLFPVMRTSNNWLDNAFNDLFSDSALSRMNSTAPAVNVKDTENAYVMEVAVPGIKKEFCRVNIDDDGNLEIAIENKLEHKEENKKEHYLRREFSYSNYQQSYILPEDVDREKISAKVLNGVLEIELPKVVKNEQKVQRKIETFEFYDITRLKRVDSHKVQRSFSVFTVEVLHLNILKSLFLNSKNQRPIAWLIRRILLLLRYKHLLK